MIRRMLESSVNAAVLGALIVVVADDALVERDGQCTACRPDLFQGMRRRLGHHHQAADKQETHGRHSVRHSNQDELPRKQYCIKATNVECNDINYYYYYSSSCVCCWSIDGSYVVWLKTKRPGLICMYINTPSTNSAILALIVYLVDNMHNSRAESGLNLNLLFFKLIKDPFYQIPSLTYR